MLNVLFSYASWPTTSETTAQSASVCFAIGGITMPLVCFLTGWKESARNLFFIPVTALIAAVLFTLLGGRP